MSDHGKHKKKKKHDPSDIHRTHGVGDTPEYIERSKLATERLDLKRRLVADRREEAGGAGHHQHQHLQNTMHD